MVNVHALVEALTAQVWDALGTVPGLRRLGAATARGPAIAFSVDGIHAHDVATIFDTFGVAVRAGHHCTMPLHDKLGVPASVRASVYLYNVPEDVTALADGLHEARRIFGLG
jgi:cysteine desulfurase/selenocysteine lyase